MVVLSSAFCRKMAPARVPIVDNGSHWAAVCCIVVVGSLK